MGSLFHPRTNGAGPSRVGARPPPGGAAGDAAAAAEFAAKRYVWIPDKEAGYLSAWVVQEEDGGEMSVCSLSDGQVSNAYETSVEYLLFFLRPKMMTDSFL